MNSSEAGERVCPFISMGQKTVKYCVGSNCMMWRVLGGKNSIPIEELDLTLRALNCLMSESISTIEKLCQKKDIDLLKIPNLGSSTLLHIKQELARRGLELDCDSEQGYCSISGKYSV